MNRNQLNEIAAEMDIETPEKLPNKPSVVKAIMDAGEEG